MTNFERIKNMDIDEMAEFLEAFTRSKNIVLKDASKLISFQKKWLLCENEVPSLEEFNSK